jgi:hypothetical protein
MTDEFVSIPKPGDITAFTGGKLHKEYVLPGVTAGT